MISVEYVHADVLCQYIYVHCTQLLGRAVASPTLVMRMTNFVHATHGRYTANPISINPRVRTLERHRLHYNERKGLETEVETSSSAMVSILF